ncbi:MAG TPA: pyridoxal-phosphate dependent enzyme [Solirubrobacteraceae bacterium]|nr:pyridoxal-phosphate dependent enzyme [Solirubrobacteraceae bacterium]
MSARAPAGGRDWALERDLDRSLAAARETRARIARFVRHTPLLELDAVAGTTRLLKLETLQRTGSFKVRGAAAALTVGARPRAVVAASTGNHGLAVAFVAAALGLPCRIFVPAGAAPAKIARLRAGGVEPVEIAGDPLLAELAAREASEQAPGTLLVPPYNDPRVILGQATLGLELLDDLADPPDALFVAVGGGGLISGVALAVRARWPHCTIVGCLPAASPAMGAAVAAGRVVAAPLGPTLSDATAGGIEPGAITVAICAALVDEFVEIEEAEIAAAMRTALLEHGLALEGAAALALAASWRAQAGVGRHVVVLGGGNVGAQTLRTIL